MGSAGLGAAHLSVGLDVMLQAVELPAGVSHLDSGLAHVDGDTLALQTHNRRDLWPCSFCSLASTALLFFFNPCHRKQFEEPNRALMVATATSNPSGSAEANAPPHPAEAFRADRDSGGAEPVAAANGCRRPRPERVWTGLMIREFVVRDFGMCSSRFPSPNLQEVLRGLGLLCQHRAKR